MLFTLVTHSHIVRLVGGRRLDQLPNRAKTLTLAIVCGGCPGAPVLWSMVGGMTRTQHKISSQSKTPLIPTWKLNRSLTRLNLRSLPQLALTS